jgi:hypothetical protein
MTDTNALAARLTELRQQFNMKSLANPQKLGAAKLAIAIADLEAKLPKKSAKTATVTKLYGETGMGDSQALAEIDKLLRSDDGCTVKHASCLLLQEITFKDANGRTNGHPYAWILERLKERFPEADTTYDCLRWYAVRVRAGEEVGGFNLYKLPQVRPRPKRKGSIAVDKAA